MITPDDAPGASEPTDAPLATPLDDAGAPLSLFQEINERRARVENAELLHHLRGL